MLTFTALKEKERSLRADFPETMGLRVHRAISWIGRAQKESDDPDAAFLFHWIAFNAAYADETEFQSIPMGERAVFTDFFARVVRLDTSRRIYRAIWSTYTGPLRLLLENRFVFLPFWQHTNGIPGHENWQDRFEASRKVFHKATQDGDTAKMLSLVFDRLYVLRCQLVHGGTTWGSYVNRAQVQDSAAILGTVMPLIADIMLDNPTEPWGRPFYPVIDAPEAGVSGSAKLG